MSSPAAFATRLVRKFASFWWFPVHGRASRIPDAWLLAYRSLYGARLVAACSGFASPGSAPMGPERQRLVLVLALLAEPLAAQSLFYVDVRHRWAVEPLLGIFLAAAVGRWLPAADSRTRASS